MPWASNEMLAGKEAHCSSYHGQHDVQSLLLGRHLRAHIFACSLGDLSHDRVLSYPSTAETTGTDYGVGGWVFVLVHT